MHLRCRSLRRARRAEGRFLVSLSELPTPQRSSGIRDRRLRDRFLVGDERRDNEVQIVAGYDARVLSSLRLYAHLRERDAADGDALPCRLVRRCNAVRTDEALLPERAAAVVASRLTTIQGCRS